MTKSFHPLPGFMTEPTSKQPRKRLFIGLVVGTSVILCLLLLMGWIVPYVGFGNIHPSVPYVTGGLLVFTLVCIAFAALGLISHIVTGTPPPCGEKVRGAAIRVFLPLMEILGRCLGIKSNEVRRSFIKVNNELTLGRKEKFTPNEILVLLPHCIQNASCPLRLSYNPESCKRCGKCPVGDLLVLKEKYGVHLAVATGGSIARRLVVDLKPRMIIAVACERDLTSGIQDTYPLPVFGILNSRPDGPCRNTQVAISLVEEALVFFMLPGSFPLSENTPSRGNL